LWEVIGAHRPGCVIAAWLSINECQVHQWRGRNLTERQADEPARRAGCHPAEIWPDWSGLL
jgi:hypothetical protein